MPTSNLTPTMTISNRNKRVTAVSSGTSSTPMTAAKAFSDTHSFASSSSGTSKSYKADDDIFWSRRSNTEERQRIREFWLHLREDERRSLVKIEKEAVLKRMKEQQRHSCNCSVCGKKRTAIENELEVLYDAYYEELEQYANNQQNSNINPLLTGSLPPSDNESDSGDQGDDGGEEENDDGEYYDDTEQRQRQQDHPSGPHNEATSEQLSFSNNLAVKGGLLTVADDLLRNNGKKFLDMMERLAERRIRKEKSSVYTPDDDDDEDDGYYDDEEDDPDFDEEDIRTDGQRMEEGRRMFHIFAARMFEQRVLAAYREKIAQERQQRLLEELEEEERLRQEREAKKQKEKERKKDRKRELKKKKEDERRTKEAQKKLEEERLQVEKERVFELERRKRDQERRRKEEEKVQREEQRRQRIKEERERAAEKERRRQERELKKTQERVKQEERERRERQFKEEKERRERELKEEMERRDRDMEERKLRWEKEEECRKGQQTLIDALVGSSSSSSPSPSLHSESSPKNRTASISPIGVLPCNGFKEKEVAASKPSLISPATENSFFSNFLFDEPDGRVRDSCSVPLVQSGQDNEKFKGRTHTLPSSDTPIVNWTNGWTASSLLSEDIHERLFGDILPDRNTMILERAKMAYRKLNEISKTPSYMGLPPPIYTLTQVVHMMNDMYSYITPVNIQELHHAMIVIPSSPFRCTVDPQRGVLVYLYEPIKSNIRNHDSRYHMTFSGFSSALYYEPLGQQHHQQQQPPVVGQVPLFKGMS